MGLELRVGSTTQARETQARLSSQSCYGAEDRVAPDPWKMESHDGSHRRPESLHSAANGSISVHFDFTEPRRHNGRLRSYLNVRMLLLCLRKPLNFSFRMGFRFTWMTFLSPMFFSQGLLVFPCDGVAGKRESGNFQSASRSHPPG